MAKSLKIRKNIIQRPGDKEVVGKMGIWRFGENTLSKAIEEEVKRVASQTSK